MFGRMIYFGCGSSGKCRFIVIPDPKHVSCHPNVDERLHPGRGATHKTGIIWANYNDLSRGHPKMSCSKGIPQKIPLYNRGLGIIVNMPT